MTKARCLPAFLCLALAFPAVAAQPAPLATGKAAGSFTVKGKTWSVSSAAAVARPSEFFPDQNEIKVFLTPAPIPADQVTWDWGDAPAVLATVAPKASCGFNILYPPGGSASSNQEFVVTLTQNDGKIVAGRIQTTKEILGSTLDITFRAAVVKVK